MLRKFCGPWRRHSKYIGSMRWTYAISLCILLANCKPPDQKILVATVRGNYISGIRARSWNYGEVRVCELASKSTVPPDTRGDLLLCGSETQDAWGNTEDNKGRSDIYSSAVMTNVKFLNSGHPGASGSKFSRTIWHCQKSMEGVLCQ